MRAFIVEDDFAMRQVLEEKVRLYGYEVNAYEDATSALNAYRTTFAHLVFLDLGLPDMDGTELCRRIRAYPRGKYSLIVILSARRTPQDIQAALEAGADDYLTKPIELDFLDVRFTIIARQLHNVQQRKHAEEALLAHQEHLEQLVEARTHKLSQAVTEAQRLNDQLRQAMADRERAEELTRKLVTAIETIPLGVTITNLNGEIMYVNPADATMHGYTIEELLGKDIGIFAPPEYRNPLPPERIEALGIRVRESVNLHKDRGVFPVSLISTLVKTQQGEPMAIVTTCEDITTRKRAEEALRKSEQQYRLLAENVTDGIGIIQHERWVFGNVVLCSLFGCTLEQLVEKDDTELYPQACQTQAKHLHRQVEAGREPAMEEPFEFSISRNEREIWIESLHRQILWEGRSAILVTMRDITASKLKEMEHRREQRQLRKELITLKTSMRDRYRFGDIIGKSRVMQEVYELILSAAAVDDHVVVYGESGTGKELIAMTIHHLSHRQKNAFIPVNCGAIPEALFEDEAFGHRKGAFTGAHANAPGFFDAAHNGSLFLDEVGELNSAMQVKLLRALGGGGYTPVGSQTVKCSNVRIIAATNRNLKELVRQEHMREDFFYRIHVIAITVPPLRERKEDLPLLIDYFLQQYDKSFRYSTFPAHVLEHMYAYDWPGNVRELENTLKRYVTTHHLDFIGAIKDQPAQSRTPEPAMLPGDARLREALAAYEKELILHTLDRYHWNKTKAAKKLGLSRQSLLRRLEKYEILDN